MEKGKWIAFLLFLFSLSFMLASCGGGDGDSSGTVSTKVWGTAVLVETDNAGNIWSPKIAMDSSGNAIAVWQQMAGTISDVWTNRYVWGSGWGTAVLLAPHAGNAGYPQIAMDSSGNAIAVWSQHEGPRYGVWANRFN